MACAMTVLGISWGLRPHLLNEPTTLRGRHLRKWWVLQGKPFLQIQKAAKSVDLEFEHRFIWLKRQKLSFTSAGYHLNIHNHIPGTKPVGVSNFGVHQISV
jgi:hypothetical protein